MKLHLPAFLRKAVLACLAALAMPFTVGSGSAFLSSGAFISFVLSQQAFADGDEVGTQGAGGTANAIGEDSDNLDTRVLSLGELAALAAIGEVRYTGESSVSSYIAQNEVMPMALPSGWDGVETISSGGAFEAWQQNNEKNVAGGRVILEYSGNGTDFYFGPKRSIEIHADVCIGDGGLNIKNGYSGMGDIVFNGRVLGSGKFNYIGSPTGQHWYFRGDMSQYSGDISVTGGSWHRLKFQGNTSGTGAITITTSDSEMHVEGATMLSSSIDVTDLYINVYEEKTNSVFEVGTLTVSTVFSVGENAEVAFNSSTAQPTSSININCDAVLGDGATMSIGTGATVTLGAAISMGEGASVVVDGTLKVGVTSAIALGAGAGSLLFNAEGGELTLTKGGSLGTLEMATGASLSVQSGALSLGELALQGDMTLKVMLENGVTLDIGEVTGAGKVTVALLDAALDFVTDEGYQLFTDWNKDLAGIFSCDDTLRAKGIYLDAETGKIKVEGLTWNGGEMTWANGVDGGQWSTIADDKYFSEGKNVKFTGKGTVTVADSVAPGNLTISGGNYTFTGGTIASQGSIDVKDGSTVLFESAIAANGRGLNISGGSTVLFNDVTNGKNLGNIRLTDKDSTLRITATVGSANWENSGVVSGAGTLSLSLGEVILGSSNGSNIFFHNILGTTQATAENPGIAKVVLEEGTFLDWQTSNGEALNAMTNIQHLYVSSGAVLRLYNGSALSKKTADSAGANVLHLSGTGSEGEWSGALHVKEAAANSIVWNVQLEKGGATICAAANATITGTFDAAGETLTKTGDATLTLQSVNTSSGRAGVAKIDAGTLKLSYTVDNAGLAFKEVNVAAGATLDIAGNHTYTIGRLTGAGLVTSSSSNAVLRLDVNAADGVAVSSADIRGVSRIEKVGTGTQKLTGAYQDGNVQVDGGVLTLGGVAPCDLTGALVKSGGTLVVENSAMFVNNLEVQGVLRLTQSTLRADTLKVHEDSKIELDLMEGEAPVLSIGDFDGMEHLTLSVFGKLRVTYHLFDPDRLPGGAFTVANIDLGDIKDDNRKVVANYNQGDGTLFIDGENFDLRWTGGSFTWGNRLKDVQWVNDTKDHGGETNFFVYGDSVTLDGTAVKGNVDVTVSTSVTPGNVTVLTDADTDYNITGEAISAAEDGTLTVKGSAGKVAFHGDLSVSSAEVSGGAALELAGSAVKSLGSIAVGEGSEVIISTLGEEGARWEADQFVSGKGTLVFKGIDAPSAGDDANLGVEMMGHFLSGTAKELHALALRDADVSVAREWSERLGTVENIIVEGGASLGLRDTEALEGTGRTLHLAGAGKKGKGALYADADVAVTWDVTLDDDASISSANEEGDHTLTLSGVLNPMGHALTKSGAGTLILTQLEAGDNAGNVTVDAGTLTLNLTEPYEELAATRMEVKKGATLSLAGGKTYSISYLTGSGKVSSKDGASLTIEGDSTKGVAFTGTMSGLSTLTKTGDGKQSLSAIGAKTLEVKGGELIYTGSGAASSYTPSAVRVSKATLTLAETGSLAAGGSSLQLADGAALKLAAAKDGLEVKLGALSSTGKSANSLVWAEDTHAQSLSFSALSGAANLNVGSLNAAATRTLSLGELNDYTGKLSGKVSGKSMVSVGNIHSAADGGAINVTGGVHVLGSMAKSGAGAFSINHLIVDKGSSLSMNYADGGELSITTLQVADGGILHYNSGKAGDVVRARIRDLIAGGEFTGTIRLDVWDVEGTLLEQGMCLGIEKGDMEVDAAALVDYFSIDFSEWGGDFDLKWGADDLLYLNVTRVSSQASTWDPNWGVSVVKTAPSTDALKKKAELYLENDLKTLTKAAAQDFTYVSLALGDAGVRYKGEGSYYILLTDGPGSADTRAAVLGGRVYREGEPGSHEGDSFIYLRPDEGKSVYFHLLVGGSACVTTEESTADPAEAPGYYGNSHIQMEGGTVDFIIGGNHVTNSAFTFVGNSFISVYDGASVRGGIVGGSTLTAGTESSHEFEGNSRIYIYTPLTTGTKVPSISDATHSGEGSATGLGFAAVVGGNAWIDLPTDAQPDSRPTFKGTSLILVDLRDYKGTGTVFDKAIVGGNYTAPLTDAASAVHGTRSTIFAGSAGATAAYVRIAAGDEVSFTGGISGASRRASGGDGSTIFSGDTLVLVEGGTYRQAIAGGFWFEETADGHHESTLTGDTAVRISKGQVWRAVGGSYSLGGSDRAQELQEGSSTLSISGDTVVNSSFHDGDAGQMSLSFVAGGSFYRDSQGSYERVNGNTLVEISGNASLGLVTDGIHVVGGDYANFSHAEQATASISGDSGVSISGGSISGIVVGGSYLTDEGQGGSVRITGTASVSMSGGSVAADSVFSAGHVHSDVAIVGGSALVDEGAQSGKHAAEVGATAVSISGGVVDGHVVGGNFSNDAAGVNTLSVGESRVSISGGEVYGNVYGGHYSANMLSPDKLVLGDVTVTLSEGARVKGNIVGGSFRLAVNPMMEEADAPQQGSILVQLLGGTLDGDVYAAGWHDSLLSDSLSVRTASTCVEISNEVLFENLEGPGLSVLGAVTVSGGYMKATGAADLSTVTGESALVFTSSGGYENLDRLSFVDFNSVSVAGGTSISLGEGRFYARDNVSFTKKGAGSLSLDSLQYRNANGAVRRFTGKISVLGGGSLQLHSEQSVDKGLAFDLSHGINTRESAYLQAVGEGKLVVAGQKNVAVEILLSEEGPGLRAGTYYLADGFESAEALEAFKLIAPGTPDYRMYLDMVGESCLALRVRRYAPDEWLWEGEETAGGNIWDGTTTDNWTYEGAIQDAPDVHFSAGVLREDVAIKGTVRPSNVYIEGGNYTFTQVGGTKGGLDIVDTLYVGNAQTQEPASLRLELANKAVPHVDLLENGVLMLAHKEALNGLESISFDGGVLGYAVDARGELLNAQDLSAYVAAGGAGAIRLRVGEPGAAATAANVTWGGKAATVGNEGIRRILEDGLELSGSAGFTVEWAAAGDPVTGAATVLGGHASYMAHVQEGGSVALENDIRVEAGGSVSLNAQGGAMVVHSALSGAGEVAVGDLSADATYEIAGDNTGFGGTLSLVGAGAKDSILVRQTAALGGADTTLALRGRQVTLASTADATIAAGVVLVDGENYLGGSAPKGVNAGITLQGELKAAGEQSVLVAAGAAHHTVQGSVAGYTGTLKAAAEESVWTLGNEQSAPLADAATISANLSGKGKVRIAYRVAEAKEGSSLQLAGALTDSIDLENASDATIIIAGNSANTSTGKLIATGAPQAQLPEAETPAPLARTAPEPVSAGGSFRLGTAQERGVWAGTELVGGADKSLTLVNGSLTNGITAKGDMQLKVDTSAAQGDTTGLLVEAGGTRGSLLDAVTLGANTRLSGVSGDIVVGAGGTDMSGTAGSAGLVFGASNIGSGKGADSAYLLGSDGGDLVVAQSAALSVDFSNDGFVELLKKHRAENAKSYAHVLSGGGSISFRDVRAETALQMVLHSGGYAELLGGLSFHYVGVSHGDIMITGSSAEVYLVLPKGEETGDPHTVSDYGLLDSYLATVVDKGETLSICVGDDLRPNADGTPKEHNNLTVNNLVGLEGSTLLLSRLPNTERDVTISLNNAGVKVSDELGLPEGISAESLSCIDTEFDGAILSEDEHVHLNKVGPGSLTVGSKDHESGGLSLAGDLRLSGGSLITRGKESTLNNVIFAYETEADSASAERRGLVVSGGLTVVSGSISEQGSYGADNAILLEQGGELRLTGSSDLATTAITAAAGETLSLTGAEASLRLGGSSKLEGAVVQLSEGGTLSLAEGAQMNAAAVELGEGSALTVGGDQPHTAAMLTGEGTLRGDAGTLLLTGTESVFTGRFEGAATLSISKGGMLDLTDAYMDVNSGKWSLTNSGTLTIDVSRSNQDVALSTLTLAGGSETLYIYDTDRVGSRHLINLDGLIIERSAKLTIRSTGREAVREAPLLLGSVKETSGLFTGVTLEGLAFLHYDGSLQWKNGELYLNLRLKDENPLLREGMEKNAAAGADLFYAATGPEGNWLNGVMENPDSQLSKMSAALEQMSSSGDTAALSRTLAAGAGASVSALGSALSQDLQRQLSAIRTRTTSMGSDVTTAPGARCYSMWINGEGGYHKLKADSLAPGFTLQGWGGTVGMHAELAPGASVGLAVSAMYNDLKTDSADNGRGDMDTTYLSLFGRKTVGAWMHTIVLSGGLADVSLNRTVNYGEGSYSTKGSTDGYSVGLLYELGYSKLMNAEGSFILQPVFNIELRRSGVKGYTETGSDAGLRVDDISQSVLTFGLGARMQRIVGENFYNRATVFEGRFLLKADAGDNSGKANTALINGAPRTAELESAEVGSVGIEIGAGLSIPIGMKAGALFMDASVELRKDYTSVDANVGYRINF